jgi:hypothetical protein
LGYPSGLYLQESAMNSAGNATKAVAIEIYVASHCFVCDFAQEIAELIRREYPQIPLRWLDIEQGAVMPENVFATPTYLLNGQVWFLGNPTPEQVRHALAELGYHGEGGK